MKIKLPSIFTSRTIGDGFFDGAEGLIIQLLILFIGAGIGMIVLLMFVANELLKLH